MLYGCVKIITKVGLLSHLLKENTMKTRARHWLAALATVCAGAMPVSASGQINEIVNGLTNVAITAARQGQGYKGYMEADFTHTFGNYKSNFLTLATSQGYMLNDHFYLGAGVGIDFMWTTLDKGWGEDQRLVDPAWSSRHSVSSAVMIPVFSDFRYIVGRYSEPTLFLNMRIGCAFLCTDSYVRIADGYLTNKEYFYLQPAIGVRVPINRTKPRQAVDFGVHYRLMTARYWSGWQHDAAINGLGLNITYEW